MRDGAPFVFDGLWEAWKNPSADEWLHTCTIIADEPNEPAAQVHARMLVILLGEARAKWLSELEDGDPKGTAEALSGRAYEGVANQRAGERSKKTMMKES